MGTGCEWSSLQTRVLQRRRCPDRIMDSLVRFSKLELLPIVHDLATLNKLPVVKHSEPLYFM